MNRTRAYPPISAQKAEAACPREGDSKVLKEPAASPAPTLRADKPTIKTTWHWVGAPSSC